MSQAAVQLILALIPVAERLIFDVGGKMIELNTSEISAEELAEALKNSTSETWPKLKFKNTGGSE